ncbi:MAG: hypothetical protein K0R93_3412 [Anaerosolibacter sp.]|jgi:hypothetical protein|uniref:hypothetical protein n=1 Tax=Anaerosolibacter sp. TaxID=1872527 RepID=UPI002607F251|nr:hypothetical protein [Anaerosolibacter sp.]MDF2548514.1 hypothetical protein [Anaerosolibacter sp.]
MYGLLNQEDLKALEKYVSEEIKRLEHEQKIVQTDMHLSYGVNECRLALEAIRHLLFSYNEYIS